MDLLLTSGAPAVRENTGTPSGSVPAPAQRGVDDAHAVPRVLTFATVKRIDPRLPNTWGHWWIELDDHESYGWWPTPCPMGWRGAIFGSRGCLNGIDAATGGTATRDAYHGDDPDHSFHPTLIVAKSDEHVRADIRAFAQSYVGGFRWQWWWLREPAQNCRVFQQALFETVGLFEEPEYLYTQGPGCPFMYQLRRVKWGVSDRVVATFGWLRPRREREELEATSPETADRQVNGAGNVDNAVGEGPAAASLRTPGVDRPDGAALAALRFSSKRRRRWQHRGRPE